LRKLIVQRSTTSRRFWKPIRKKRWTTSHVTHAGKPERRSPLMSATAFERPIVARLPLSK